MKNGWFFWVQFEYSTWQCRYVLNEEWMKYFWFSLLFEMAMQMCFEWRMDEIALFHLFKFIVDDYAILCEVRKKNGLNCCSLFSLCHWQFKVVLFLQLRTNKSQWQQFAIGTSGTSYTIPVVTSVGQFSLGDSVFNHIENQLFSFWVKIGLKIGFKVFTHVKID